jgi:hypothetical protein
MAIASVQDVATSLGRPITSTEEIAQVNQWLGNAELLIRARLGDVALLDAEAVAYVETEAVVRKVRNPDGKVSEDIDDYRYRYGENAASGAIFITDAEWALLAPGGGSGAFSVTPGFVSDGVWP